MIFRSLASSSKGNAYMVSDGDTIIMLECGMTYKRLQQKARYVLQTVSACFVTHEHNDHALGAKMLLKHGMPVYMSERTARALDLQDAEIVDVNKTVRIDTLRVMPFKVYHDAAQPVGYIIDDPRAQERMLFATDTRNLDVAPSGLTMIAVECNYEDEIIARSSMHEKLKERIRHTHFEVNDVIKYLHKLDLTRCERIYLMHLSAKHSNEIRWKERFVREFPGIDIQICPE